MHTLTTAQASVCVTRLQNNGVILCLAVREKCLCCDRIKHRSHIKCAGIRFVHRFHVGNEWAQLAMYRRRVQSVVTQAQRHSTAQLAAARRGSFTASTSEGCAQCVHDERHRKGLAVIQGTYFLFQNRGIVVLFCEFLYPQNPVVL